MSEEVYRQQCAAVTNGCRSVLVWEGHGGARLLELNGWYRDKGEWVCPLHLEAAK